MRFAEYEDPEGDLEWLIRKDGCMHCQDPGCLKACPSPGAIVQYSNGIVDFVEENCIGCGYCISGGVRFISPALPLQLQCNKNFQPHVLVVPAGSVVEFPNRDPFFHNVFSLFDGKRFDLGLYEGGSSNSARFEHPFVSFLFCNIHPEMSAAIVSVDTPYYALSDPPARSRSECSDGRYLMHIWYERSSVEELKSLERVVVLSTSTRNLAALKSSTTAISSLATKTNTVRNTHPHLTRLTSARRNGKPIGIP